VCGFAAGVRGVALPAWDSEDRGGYGRAQARDVDWDDADASMDLERTCAIEDMMLLQGFDEEDEEAEFDWMMGMFRESASPGSGSGDEDW